MTTEAAADLEFVPAGESDMAFIRDTIANEQLDDERLEASQFVTIRDGEKIVAFGRIKPYEHTYELGAVCVVPEARGRGLGAAITRELIRRFPRDEVFLTTNRKAGLPAYYEKLGFLRTDTLPEELEAKCERIRARGRLDPVGMVYDRNYDRLPTIADVYGAKHVLDGQLEPTPLLHNPLMSRELGFEAYLKLENLLPIGRSRCAAASIFARA